MESRLKKQLKCMSQDTWKKCKGVMNMLLRDFMDKLTGKGVCIELRLANDAFVEFSESVNLLRWEDFAEYSVIDFFLDNDLLILWICERTW